MNDLPVTIHILPDGRMVVACPSEYQEEVACIREAVTAWLRGDHQALVINRAVEVVVHKP